MSVSAFLYFCLFYLFITRLQTAENFCNINYSYIVASLVFTFSDSGKWILTTNVYFPGFVLPMTDVSNVLFIAHVSNLTTIRMDIYMEWKILKTLSVYNNMFKMIFEICLEDFSCQHTPLSDSMVENHRKLLHNWNVHVYKLIHTKVIRKYHQ